MFHRYLAAALLLPASFAVHGSLRVWLKTIRMGKHAFFSQVIKKGSARISRPDSFARALLVYYPMKAGMEILRAGSLLPVLKKAWRITRLRLAGGVATHPNLLDIWSDRRPPFVPPEHILAMIRDPDVKTVSFDVFDTLLLRPALHPKDIFHLLARKVDAAHGVDFIKLRWNAEAELGKANADIHHIYAHMVRRHKLAPATAEALLAEEIHCETTLLSPRPDVEVLYREAVRLGKRVIAVSDMYLPGTVLGDILKKKGCGMDAVYVSCDHDARKSDGALYDVVLSNEKTLPSKILHVGDNYQSDYVQAVQKNISAVWLPSIQTLCFSNEAVREALFGKAVRREPLWSIFLGLSLNRLYGGGCRTPEHIAELKDIRQFAELTLAPLVTAFGLFLATDRDIQQAYKTIHFASRDGWLPHKVYSLVRDCLGGVPGVYFHAGRRAYYPFLHDTFFDFAASLSQAANMETYTLRDFLEAWFKGEDLLDRLGKGLSPAEAALPFFLRKVECLRILRRFEKEIADCMRAKRTRAQAYYDRIFDPSEKRHLVFDLGYSGSIGKALAAVTGKPVDKIYFWEEPENRTLDRASGSTTRLFMNDGAYVPYHLVLEELFSPCEGGVTGFDAQGNPVLENLTGSHAHEADLAAAHATCLEYAGQFCAILGEYAQYAVPHAPGAAMDVFRALLNDAPFCNAGVFKNIVFPDPVYRRSANSLEKKLEIHLPCPTVFSGTGFNNPRKIFASRSRPRGDCRIGMHLHLYHAAVAHEIVRYLQDFPVPFDLHITITDASFAATARNLFSRAFLPLVREVRVLTVPNRGRDVAPWVLGMRPYQAGYDLFCHIHSKESAHIGFGDEWRAYLFDNLIRSDSVAEIISSFENDPGLGCLFPDIHPKVRQVMTGVGAPLYGSEHEYAVICDMLRRMELGGEICRSELFFSVGTMLWYRPHALRQLFICELHIEEFAAEPIGVGGTLAHALERLPALIAVRNGYAAKSLTRHAAFPA